MDEKGQSIHPHASIELLSEMIGLIYKAAADLTLWPPLLESMTAYLEQPVSEREGMSASSRNAEQELLRFLAPHFEQADSLHRQLAEVVEERNLLENVMNRLPLGAAIIDEHGLAISFNRTLVSLLQGSKLLRIRSGRLVSEPSFELEQAIAAVRADKNPDVLLRLGDEQEHLSLWLSRGGRASHRNRIMVLVASRGTQALSEAGLTTFFGLTPAEARVTQKLVLGSTLEEVADALHISRNTAKTHLLKAFGKVGVKRQIDLIQAIYASPLWLQDQSAGEPVTTHITQRAQSHLPGDDRFITLSDGRKLCYSDSGDPNGMPVMLIHGIAGSRTSRHPDDGLLVEAGIRLIIPERPGSGESDPKPGRRITDWPNDLIELADLLGLKQFNLIGYSAGTSYALAVAARFPERVGQIHIVAAVPPIRGLEDLRNYHPVFRMTLTLAKYIPGLLPPLIRIMVKDIRTNVYQYIEKMIRDAPELDRATLANPRLRASIVTGLRDSVRHGEAENSLEVTLAAGDWGFDLSGIRHPVKLWHGKLDPLVAPSGACTLADQLPHAEVELIADAGHYLLYTHWHDILRSFASNQPATA